MRSVLILVTAATLAGCTGEAASVHQSRRAQRREAAELQLSRTPQPRTYHYPDGELRVLQVPVADGLGFVEQQQCFVWRDAEFRTATISCSVPPDVSPPN